MTAYTVRVSLRVECRDLADLDSFTDALMDELVSVNDGADLGGSLATGCFDLWVVEEAPSPSEAASRGVGTVRAAAYAAAGAAREWPRPDEWPDWLRETAVEASEVEARVAAG